MIGHNTVGADVWRAFNRFKERTNDPEARLEREDGNGPTLWRLESRAFWGEWVGAARALTALDSFLIGWQRREEAEAARRGR